MQISHSPPLLALFYASFFLDRLLCFQQLSPPTFDAEYFIYFLFETSPYQKKMSKYIIVRWFKSPREIAFSSTIMVLTIHLHFIGFAWQ